jgi:hypothetical protein
VNGVAGERGDASGALEQRAQLSLDRFECARKPPAVAGFLEGLPELEQPPGQRQAGLAELLLLARAFGVAAEVALEVRLMPTSA